MPMSRRQLYGLIHKGAKVLLQSAEREAYEDWLWQQTQRGEREDKAISCTDLSFEELSRLVDVLRGYGALPAGSAGPGGQGADRPTQRQRRMLAGMVKKRGWEGLDDPRLQNFCRRTCKVSHVRFLSRKQMSDLLTGMERWESQTGV